ncbi:MAG: response regulator [Oscillatoriophycideae cyanobacterium NC_groundwater_1537_Pr4_S-0.65um_50_18]|nr:response regulator [Oscillatoriophycideae cyanobacterium NC_groundwater_1537_Pr4_S-0.65um_50_18]
MFPPLPKGQFVKHLYFLRNLGQLRFSGQLIRKDSANRQWRFYLSQGSMLYATGGEHPVRRWRRNLTLHGIHKISHSNGHIASHANGYETAQEDAWISDLNDLSAEDCAIGWEYALLNLWVSRQEITEEQAAKIALSNIVEVLFEIAQAGVLTDEVHQGSFPAIRLRLIKLEKVTARTQVRWQTWQDAKLGSYSPHRAPVIRQAEQIQNQTSAAFYQNLVTLLNGQRTLQDLSVQMRRDVTEVTLSLLPFIQLGWIELVQIPDLPTPRYPLLALLPQSAKAPVRQKLIACVDDSFLVRHMMEKLLTSAGYQFMGVDDAVRSIGVLLSRKPDLIFLDLMMPNANGHEICEQLRKLSLFRHTPIVILTSSDGYANRLRSNFVGASDFLSKPLEAEAVLSVIRKHLEPQVEPQASLSLAADSQFI